MIKTFKKLVFNYRYKKEVKKATAASSASGRKYFVLLLKGTPVTVSKQQVTRMARTGKFKKGITVQEIEKQALFVTTPSKK